MGKYSNLSSDIFSIFGTDTWKAEKIKTYPNSFIAVSAPDEFIRVSIVPSKPSDINIKSISGILLIDIFIQAGNGPKRSYTIADKLDSYLAGKALNTRSGTLVQFLSSTIDAGTEDTDNKSLYRTIYTIPFTYSEVM